MANTIALGLVVGLAAGAAGAGVATVLQADPAPTETVASLSPGSDSSALNAELKQLREANKKMLDRLSLLESGSMRGARTTVIEGGAQEVDMEGLKAELEEYLASLRSPAAGPPKHFEQWVEASMESIDDRKDAERAAERKAREDEQFEERLTKMTTDLGLDNIQSGQMRKALGDQRIAREDIRTQAREIEDRRESWTFMREGLSALNESTNSALQGFLSPSQFDSYSESFQDNGFGGRGGFGGGDGGGRGGRGGGGGF